MIQVIIFDLDGVLLDVKDIHFAALNYALKTIDPKYVITRQEHLSIYDGLPTTKKLELLTTNKGLSVEHYNQVYKLKQQMTIKVVEETVPVNVVMQEVLAKIKQKGYRIYVASNSIRASLELMLTKSGLIQYVDAFFSNEDVIHPKPHSEIYLRCMIHAKVNPKECLIIEDSVIGRKAAIESGAFLFGVDDSNDVTYDNIEQAIELTNKKRNKWQANKMNILIPMAGIGSRFESAGYVNPKPMINVNGKPMIQVVIDSLNIEAHYIFIVQRTHYVKYNMQYLFNIIAPNNTVIPIEGVTEGAACTTLLAKEYINNEKPLLIANSDQYIEWDSSEFFYSVDKIDGEILTFEAIDPKWSFVKLDDSGFVSQVAEKEPISNIANCGIYYFKHGSDYVKYCEQMILKNIRINNEFYVAPVYNEAIADGKKIKNYNVNKMLGLGTPEDLNYFLKIS